MKSKKNKPARLRKVVFALLSVLLLLSLGILAYSPSTNERQILMTKDLISAFVNNEVNSIISQTTDAEVVRMLPYDFSTPKNPPDPANFSSKNGKICYKDSTIEVTLWKELYTPISAELCFADIRIKHPSQFRRQWSYGNYNTACNQYPSNIFATTNGVIGMSSDFYKFRDYGIIIQYGKVLCNKRSHNSRQKYLDVLVIDYNGDFKIWKDNELSDYIEKHGADDIMLSFTFGPALIENGKMYDPDSEIHYPIGEPHSGAGRVAIGQLGKLHYLFCTLGYPGTFRKYMAEIMAEKGCVTAYNLDGGQTGTIVIRNRVYNTIAYKGEQRPMSDIMYFCSAE